MKYFIANWKAHKSLEEADKWFAVFIAKIVSNPRLTEHLTQNKLKIIIAPSYPFLANLSVDLVRLKNLIQPSFKNIKLAAQDLSSFPSGNQTGEVSAEELKGLVDYVIVGHSERRRLLGETNETIIKKIQQAKKFNIEPILCVRGRGDLVKERVNFVTYEPVHSIGTGDNESLNQVIAAKKNLGLTAEIKFFYGGSVNDRDIQIYLRSSEIQGFMVGTASQNPRDFYNLVALA